MTETTPQPQSASANTALLHIRAIAGAIIGAGLGYWLFLWCMRQGYVLLPLPGVLIGFGRDIASRHRSWPIAALCALLALAVQGFIVEKMLLSGFRGMGPNLWGAYLVGAALAFWFGAGKLAAVSKEER